MRNLFYAVRSFLFVLWMSVTVVPWAVGVILYSAFVRGDRMFWACAGWLRLGPALAGKPAALMP